MKLKKARLEWLRIFWHVLKLFSKPFFSSFFLDLRYKSCRIFKHQKLFHWPQRKKMVQFQTVKVGFQLREDCVKEIKWKPKQLEPRKNRRENRDKSLQ